MSQTKDLISLPTELLLYIFKHVDSDSMLKLTETCTKFKDIIEDSDQLMKKLTLYVEYPCEAEAFMAAMKQSTRVYRNIKIKRSNKYFESIIPPSEVFESVAQSIQKAELNWSGYFIATSLTLTARLLAAGIEERHLDIAQALHRHDGFIMRRMMLHFEQRGEEIGEDVMPAFLTFHRPDLMDNVRQQTNLINRIRDAIKREFFREFITILELFPSLHTLGLSDVHGMEIPTVFSHQPSLSSIRSLSMKKCDQTMCVNLLAPCINLEEVYSEYPVASFGQASQHDYFVRFIGSLENLKVLSLKSFRGLNFNLGEFTFKFKLNFLQLIDVFFINQDNTEKFFTSQNQLKFIELDIKGQFPANSFLNNAAPTTNFSEILRIIFTNNPSLESVILHKEKYAIENVDFVRYIVNSCVKYFKYSVTAEDKDVLLFKTLSRNFPNVEEIEFISEGGIAADNHATCFEDYRVFNRCRSMAIINSTIHTLPNINANNLVYFEYSPGRAGEFIDDYIGGFFHRHRGIKHLVIGTKTRSSLYFFVSFNLCQLIANFLDKLETLTIYNFAEINRSVKCLCLHPKLRSLTIAQSQLEKFTKSTREMCENKFLKVIPEQIEEVVEYNPMMPQ